ncbi:MAG: CBS domain-containing protein [Euryarchaeota archaeon]|nr:CBS domain-containing protein [Euryarchaeota archaeon]MDE1835363.1 CBS domain-containing protein [Euryarchaeota archaeon]MDE1880466.1 CBS domain-containing protein [Euryarchaeota archaeon]MDE2043659.1 CBS domain-containing protein [Thermoplasmata archaeon]
MHEKLVSDAMTRPVRFVRPEDTLATAAGIMREHHISGLPVLDPDGKLCGIISERDIVKELHKATGVGSPRGLLDIILEAPSVGGVSSLEATRRRLQHARVEEAMSGRPVTVDADDTLEEAIRIFRQYSVNRLPVMDKERMVGILTRQDAIIALAGEVRRSANLPTRLIPQAHPGRPRLVTPSSRG